MRALAQARSRIEIKRLKATLDQRFAANADDRPAGVAGAGLVSVSGQYYTGAVEYGEGAVAVENIGRASAAVYAPGGSGGAVIVTGGGGSSSGGGGGGGTMIVHALDSTWHTGLLPWARLNFGASALVNIASRPHSALTGIGANDHHNAATAGTGITVSGAQVISINAHDILALHSVTGGAANDIIGQSAAGTLARLTPSSDVSAGVERILKSNASGYVTVRRVIASQRIQTPIVENASGDLDLNASSNRVRLLSANRLQSDTYASQTTGWAIDYSGSADFRYLYADELHAKAFIADLEQALAGGQIISKSVAVLHQTFTAPAAGGTTFLYVRDLPSANAMKVFVSGDIVRLRQFSRSGGSLSITDCWGVVQDAVGGAEYQWTEIENGRGYQRWHFTRSSGSDAGAMSSGATVSPEALVLDYGTTGNGFYEVNAIDGAYGANSPYAQVVTWATHPHTGKTVRTRMGNLYGITGVMEYGLYAGKSTTEFIKVSDTNVEMRKVPIAMYNGANLTGRWLATGDFALSPTDASTDASRTLNFIASTGALRLGQLGAGKPNLYFDGTDLHMRQNATPVITLASSGASYFSDTMTVGAASNLQLVPGASNTARVQVGTGSNVAGINALSVAGDIAFWAGAAHASRTSAPFQVTGAGALYATSGTIGSVTIDSTNGLWSGSGSNTAGMVGTNTNTHTTIFWGGANFAGRGAAPFRVTNLGNVHARNIVASVSGQPLDIWDYNDGVVSGSQLATFTRMSADRSVIGVGAQANKLLLQRLDGTNGAALLSNVGTGNLEIYTNGGRAAVFQSTGEFSTHQVGGGDLFRVAANGYVTTTGRIKTGGTLYGLPIAVSQPASQLAISNDDYESLGSALFGELYIICSTSGDSAIFLLKGANAPVMVSQTASGIFGTTYNEASRIAVGLNAGTIYITNRRGSSMTLHLFFRTFSSFAGV